ncbi:uncharacterized protein [Choristoneura fumiferana]|uniref:uncharacterized protein n=1 Tax=Choristoneura fumiferana TaxID=7141 RepID=UPI003D15DC62
MFESSKLVFLNFIFLTVTVQICTSEPAPVQRLSLHYPEVTEYSEVLIKRVGDNLTLVCEIKGDRTQRLFVWNYVAVNGSSSQRPFLIEPVGPTASSSLLKSELELEDSGQYMCSSPPFSVTKFVLVQNKGIVGCARGAFSCGPRCVLAPFVCDGRSDCEHGEDEAPPVCPAAVCQRPEMLNCSSGRCIPAAACCAPLCPSQPGCCSEHAQYNRKGEGYMEVEYPALYEDRHTPDDYGFIQSTIYTVTACALIFMIAVVLLVSALCKMHMKRAALRSYARAAAARHYTAHQTPRFPPCYEASRLLEQEAGRAPPPLTPDVAMQTTPDPQTEDGNPDPNAGYGLSRLGAIFLHAIQTGR